MKTSSPPRVSVIVPAYNAEGTIRAAIASVNAQTFGDFELIVVDDASTDRTASRVEALVRERRQREPSGGEGSGEAFRFIRLPANRGPAGARNAGLAAARGEWIAFLDGDDTWLPWRLSRQLAAIARFPDAVLISGDLVLAEPDGKAAAVPAADEHATFSVQEAPIEAFVDSNPVPTSTALARKDVILKVGGFDTQFRGPEDIDLWMRMAAAGRVIKMNVPLAVYRERPGSLSMNQDRFLPEILRVYDKAFAEGGPLRNLAHLKGRAVAGRYVSAAWSYSVCGRRWRALALLLRSWVVWPRRLKVEERRPAWRLRMLARILFTARRPS